MIERSRRFHPPLGAGYRVTPQEIHLLRLLGQGRHHTTAAAGMPLPIPAVAFHPRSTCLHPQPRLLVGYACIPMLGTRRRAS